MVAYKQHSVTLTPASGTNEVELLAPPAGTGYLVQALRVRQVITQAPPVQSEWRLQAIIRSAGLPDVFPLDKVVVEGPDIIEFDLLPKLSNLASYGVSSPTKIIVKVNDTLQTGDTVVFWGFSVTGAES